MSYEAPNAETLEAMAEVEEMIKSRSGSIFRELLRNLLKCFWQRSKYAKAKCFYNLQKGFEVV